MTQMEALAAKMAEHQNPPWYVVFLTNKMVPVAQPMAGRPHGTREDATAAARKMLASGSAVQAWVVGKDGVREVTV